MNTAEERSRHIAAQVRRWNVTADERRAIEQKLETGWRSNGPIVSLVFFALTSLAVAATFFLCDRLHLPKGWITAIAAIGIAELLIRRFRFFGTGIESALWLGGLFAWILGLTSEGKPEGLLLFAAACATAGLRVRNPLITAGCAMFFIAYLDEKQWHAAALIASLAIAAAALAALAARWQRPSTEALFVALLIAAPGAGAICIALNGHWRWGFAYLALAIVVFAAGIRLRHRGALAGGGVCVAIAAIILGDHLDLAIEWKLILCGALLIAVSAAITRALHGRSRGFVATEEKNAFEEWLRVFGTPVVAPQVGPATATPQIAGGGNFGGAGATGSF